MKTWLLEIKDNKIVNTLAVNSNGKWHILFQKEYLSNGLNAEVLSIVKNDIKKKTTEEERKTLKTTLMFNTKDVKIESAYIRMNQGQTLEEFNLTKRDQIIKEASLKKGETLVGITEGKLDDKPFLNSKKHWYTYETVPTKLINDTILTLDNNNIKVNGMVSVNSAVSTSVKKYSNLYNKIISVTLEEGYLIWSQYEDGMGMKTKTIDKGLDLIYNRIQESFGVTFSKAKELVDKFGSIPPEEVVDNKIIHTRVNGDGTTSVFSKRDLSVIITDSINKMFAHVAKELPEDYTLLFTGQVITINGFDSYAARSFTNNKTQKHINNTIGLIDGNSFLTAGALENVEVEEQQTETKLKKRSAISLFKSKLLNNKYI